jgi:hypothetical protein
MNLHSKLLDAQQFVSFYGTTAPRADLPPERVIKTADRLSERIRNLPLDGLVVYDVQDEPGRSDEPRPFPFLPTLDSRIYAQLLHERTARPVITYKSISGMAMEAWEPWLVETKQEYGINFLSLVGVSSSKLEHKGISLSQATQVAATHPAGFTLGGVVIAERHSQERPESMRILHKARNGCRFFISQAIYDATTTIQLLSDYHQLCLRQGIPPTRIILTFIPCGRAKTLEFIRWLGVSIAPQAMQAILDAPVPISKSIEICCENLRAILNQEYAQHLPLGINVESVSINREEIDASIDLFHSLQNVLQSYKQAGVSR